MSKLTLRDLHEQLAEVLGLEGIPFNIEKDIEDFVKQGWTGKEILQTVKYDREVRKGPRDLERYGITWAKFVKNDALAFYKKKEEKERIANAPNPIVERLWSRNRDRRALETELDHFVKEVVDGVRKVVFVKTMDIHGNVFDKETQYSLANWFSYEKEGGTADMFDFIKQLERGEEVEGWKAYVWMLKEVAE